jgi:hypothetical protein
VSRNLLHSQPLASASVEPVIETAAGRPSYYPTTAKPSFILASGRPTEYSNAAIEGTDLHFGSVELDSLIDCTSLIASLLELDSLIELESLIELDSHPKPAVRPERRTESMLRLCGW